MVGTELGQGKQVSVRRHRIRPADTPGGQGAIATVDGVGARLTTAAVAFRIRNAGVFFVYRPIWYRSVITSPSRIACCRLAARHGTGAACPSMRPHARSMSSHALAKRLPAPLPPAPRPEGLDGAEDLAAHVEVEVRAR
jgi:hypothetical protein